MGMAWLRKREGASMLFFVALVAFVAEVSSGVDSGVDKENFYLMMMGGKNEASRTTIDRPGMGRKGMGWKAGW